MVIVIDGKGAVLGRLTSYVAKQALKGEEFAVVNCEEIIISGNKKTTEKEYKIKRGRYGDSHRGPIHAKTSEKMVKRVIRGMLPEHRFGRGREAYKRIKCYLGVPEEFKSSEMISIAKESKLKFTKVREFAKH